MERVLICRNIALETGHEIKLRIEDARLRKCYGNAGRDLPDRQACENEGDTVQPPDPDGARPHQSAAGMPQGGK